MLRTRIILGTLMIAALLALVGLDVWVSSSTCNPSTTHGGHRCCCGVAACEDGPRCPFKQWGLPTVAVLGFLVVLATVEMGGILQSAGYEPVTAWAVVVNVGLIAIPWLARLKLPSGETLLSEKADMSAPLMWLTGGFLVTCLLVLARKRTAGAIKAIGSTCVMMLYLGLLGSFLVRIRCLDPGPAGALLVLYTILAIKACDIGAYLMGRKLGKTPLAAWLSPGKTIEGFVGGLVLSATVAGVGVLLWTQYGSQQLGPHPLTLSQAVVFGAFMAIVGHLGDLIESVYKRDIGVKDSGTAVPAFGGLLDILDSPVFAAPAAWGLLTIFSRIG